MSPSYINLVCNWWKMLLDKLICKGSGHERVLIFEGPRQNVSPISILGANDSPPFQFEIFFVLGANDSPPFQCEISVLGANDARCGPTPTSGRSWDAQAIRRPAHVRPPPPASASSRLPSRPGPRGSIPTSGATAYADASDVFSPTHVRGPT